MYHYSVMIKGLEKIPLRTNRQGSIDLIGAFNHEVGFIPTIMEQVDRGTPFKNGFIEIARIVEDEQPPMVNFEESLAKVKAKFLKKAVPPIVVAKIKAAKKAVKAKAAKPVKKIKKGEK